MSSGGAPCAVSADSKWYVQCESKDIRGPCDPVVLKSLLDTSFISVSSNVWCDGMAAWLPISAVDELKGLCSAVPQAYPPPSFDTDASVSGEHSGAHSVDGSGEPVAGGSPLVGPAASPLSPEEEEARQRKREKKRQYLQRKKMKIESGQWVESAKNLSVYVSGLPDDTTLEEVAGVFKRAGVIKIDPLTTLPKIKLYTDACGRFKNDARVTFVNKESVAFAIRYLDSYHFREGCVIHVEEAQYDPQKHHRRASAPPSAPLTAEEQRKRYLAAKYEQARLQSWTEDVDDGSGRRIVICKPMFSAEEAAEHECDSAFYNELRDEVVAEITKFVPVDKVTPIPRHPQGVVCVKLKNSADAELFISKFQGRVFDGRELEVYFFDGKTDLQAQTIPSKFAREAALAAATAEPAGGDDIVCDWIDNQSSDEEFEIRTE